MKYSKDKVNYVAGALQSKFSDLTPQRAREIADAACHAGLIHDHNGTAGLTNDARVDSATVSDSRGALDAMRRQHKEPTQKQPPAESEPQRSGGLLDHFKNMSRGNNNV